MRHQYFKTLSPYKLLLPAFLLSAFGHGQARDVIHGKVISGNTGVADVLIVNFTAEAETRTDSLGNFALKMRIGDLLVLSDRKIETKKIRYTRDLLKNNILLLQTVIKPEELDEVIIIRSRVTSASLGLSKGKIYTPAERRLRTAGDFKPIHLMALLGGGMELDPIINAINGRTKRLKKQLSAERREQLLAKMWEVYPKSELIEKYYIPADYAAGFAYYSIEDDAFSTALQAGNKIEADMQLASLSVLYLEQLANEK